MRRAVESFPGAGHAESGGAPEVVGRDTHGADLEGHTATKVNGFLGTGETWADARNCR